MELLRPPRRFHTQGATAAMTVRAPSTNATICSVIVADKFYTPLQDACRHYSIWISLLLTLETVPNEVIRIHSPLLCQPDQVMKGDVRPACRFLGN